ncbi:DNA-deoxyinosine glycosylase [Oligoflexaceae bacterium]|nr:DNA-deoxyinosine glycosylase [Oligoflexaceae bacterium]
MIEGFSAHLSPEIEFLILGSIPGKASLEVTEYYGHPRNLFWQLMEDILAIDSSLPYEDRLERILHKKIGLWDVVKRCRREGSLDSAIRNPELNDFQHLLKACPKLQFILFNGKKAEDLFRKNLDLEMFAKWTLISLPSTSPANAGVTRESKTKAWASAFASDPQEF